jgi:hypothetical protein
MVLVLRITYCSGADTSFSGRYRSFPSCASPISFSCASALPVSSSRFSVLRRSGVVRFRLRRRFACPLAWFSILVFGSGGAGLVSFLNDFVWVEAWPEQLLCFDSGVVVSRLEEAW